MGYKNENIKHRAGITPPKKGYTCPNCKESKIQIKATFVVCPSCKKVVDGEDLVKVN